MHGISWTNNTDASNIFYTNIFDSTYDWPLGGEEMNEEKDVGELFKKIAEGLCMVLDLLPSDSISFIVKVSETCVLEFTVKKV